MGSFCLKEIIIIPSKGYKFENYGARLKSGAACCEFFKENDYYVCKWDGSELKS